MRQRDASPLEEGTSKHLSWMEFSQTSPQIIRNKTPKDHQNHNQRYRNGELSQQGKIYFCRRVCRHMGTESTRNKP
jgi:hypothetical protein